MHALPTEEGDRGRLAEVLAQFGEPLGDGAKDVAVRLREGVSGLPAVVRALDAADVRLAHLEIQAPSLDDVFLAKTGRSLEGAGDVEADAAEQRPVSPVWAQSSALARRSIIRTVRQPASVVFPLIFPMLLLLVNSGGLDASTQLPGFPTDSFLAFALAVPFIQGALFSTMNAGTDLAKDIQTGFLNRLSLTSMRGVALIAGQLGGVVVMGLVQAAFYIVVGLLVGVDFAAGPLGILALFGFAAIISIGFGALGAFLALRTGSGEAIQGLFPLLFVFLFLSSMNTPRDLIIVDWFRFVATVNPVSYLIECVRSLIITGWNAEALALGFGIAVLIGIVATTLATLSLKGRLLRT